MIGDRERRFCDYGGLGILHELDPAEPCFYYGANGEGLRNVAHEPEYIDRKNKLMEKACSEMRQRRNRASIYSIQQQPFYN